jgi:hypothetical protein
MAFSPTPLDLIASVLRDAFGIDANVGGDGAIHLQFEDELNVAIALSPDHADLVLYSVLGPAAGPSGIVLVTTALALNLHQLATRGGAIGLDTENQTLVFSWRMRVAASEPPQWLNAIEQFCITTRALHAQLKESIDALSEPELVALEERARHDPAFDESGALGERTPREPGSRGAFAVDPTESRGLTGSGTDSDSGRSAPPGVMIRA